MRPIVKGPTPWAVILCRFSNVPELKIPISVFSDFISETGAGKGGVFDYWRDISYGAIDLTGSIVRGWYTMRFSFPSAWNIDRGSIVNEARRLAVSDGVDLSRYYGVMAVLNASIGAGNDGERNVIVCIGDQWGQPHWKHCRKCEGMFFAGSSQGVCPKDAGTHDGSQSGDYSMALELTDFPGQDNWRWCRKCQGLFFSGNSLGRCPAPPGETHDPSDSGAYRVASASTITWDEVNWRWCNKCQGLFFSGNPSPGPCPAGGLHNPEGSDFYTLYQGTNGLTPTFAAHEMGHAYGLAHSWLDNPETEYGDPWDIMSAMAVDSFDAGEPYRTSGPGMSAPYLDALGWLPEDRIHTFDSVPQENVTFAIAALNRPDIISPLLARVITPDRIYMVEFRQPTGWDRNVGHHPLNGEILPARPGVLIHAFRTLFNRGQYGWRWCPKCQGMFLALHAICPAGGLHDHSGSGAYAVVLEGSSASGQNGWWWCWKCEGLFFSDGQNSPPGVCPAGDQHNASGSGVYTLTVDDPAASGQQNWRKCRKCQGLAYAGNAWPGSCPVGGYHDHTGSGNYTLANDPDASGQHDWRWCRKCQGLAFAGRGVCPTGGPHIHEEGTVNSRRLHGFCLVTDVKIAAGQHRWRLCNKCQGLFFSGNPSPGPCPAGGVHSQEGSGDYALVDNPRALIQSGVPIDILDRWRWCNKCQGLTFTGNSSVNPTDVGHCPADGFHDHEGSGNYLLISGTQQDLSYLMVRGPNLDPLVESGDVFRDGARNVFIRVESINSSPAGALALVTIGPVR